MGSYAGACPSAPPPGVDPSESFRDKIIQAAVSRIRQQRMLHQGAATDRAQRSTWHVAEENTRQEQEKDRAPHREAKLGRRALKRKTGVPAGTLQVPKRQKTIRDMPNQNPTAHRMQDAASGMQPRLRIGSQSSSACTDSVQDQAHMAGRLDAGGLPCTAALLQERNVLLAALKMSKQREDSSLRMLQAMRAQLQEAYATIATYENRAWGMQLEMCSQDPTAIVSPSPAQRSQDHVDVACCESAGDCVTNNGADQKQNYAAPYSPTWKQGRFDPDYVIDAPKCDSQGRTSPWSPARIEQPLSRRESFQSCASTVGAVNKLAPSFGCHPAPAVACSDHVERVLNQNLPMPLNDLGVDGSSELYETLPFS